MRYYDITHTLNGEVPIWPGDPLFSLEQIQTIGCGSDSNLHQLSMGVHTGTHVDAPYHFLSNGKRLGEMDLSYFIGDCLVPVSYTHLDVYKRQISRFYCYI